jgi:hypothetical protein
MKKVSLITYVKREVYHNCINQEEGGGGGGGGGGVFGAISDTM